MYIAMKITAVANRDESCNLLTFSETHTFRIADAPRSETIKDLCERHKVKFLEMWPHNRQAAPTLVPLDVDIQVRAGRMP